MKKYGQLGIRGLCEKLLFNGKKLVFKIWYFNRFSCSGKNVIFEGPMDLRGGKRIRLGDSIVFSKNVRLHCCENAELTIGDGCYVAQDVLVSSNGKVRIGKGCRIHEGAVIAGRKLNIGDNVWISRYCSLSGTDVVIGDDCIFAPFTSVLDTDHDISEDLGKVTMASGKMDPVTIGQNVWVCHGATILKGVTVGDGAIIAAGAVVTKNVPSKTVVAGIPAAAIIGTK